MGRGGARPGAGRKKGIPNKRTVEREQEMQAAGERIEQALGDAFDGDAHAFLMAIYKDKTRPVEIRIDAAKAAIRYEKPALAAVEVTGDMTVHDISDEPLTADEWTTKHVTEH